MDAPGLEIEASLELYRTQLSQVEQAIQAAGESEDLVKLKSDLTELIKLTEESLLSFRKSQILKNLEASDSTSDKQDEFDDEYAAFQAAIMGGDDSASGAQDKGDISSCSKIEESDTDKELGEQEIKGTVEDSFSELVGMKCRAPFSHDWGCLDYHNALVFCIESSASGDKIPQVRVMFCNPTHLSMLPCKFFLEGNCRFIEDKCRYSHGYLVNVDDLREFEDPDYSQIKIGAKCLAQYEDGVWYRATIKDMQDDRLTVGFDLYGHNEELDIEDVFPLGSDENSESSDSGDEGSSMSRQMLEKNEDSEEEDDDMPVFLWKPPQTTQALGEWEKHTKGIGLKLMMKMGYVVGQGLGVKGEGRAEPVPIQLLPQGKSLDKIMELKAIAGDQDLFDAMKKLKKRKKAEEKKQAADYKREMPSNVFDFLNKKLRGKKGNLHDLVLHRPSGSGHSKPSQNITVQDLNKKTDRNINIQVVQTQEEMKGVQRELGRLRESLARNELRDKKVADQVRQKISSMEEYLEKLRSSERTLEQHQKKRKDNKKLTVF